MMTKPFSFILFMMLAAGLAASARAEGANLLKNGSFEGGKRYWFQAGEASLARGDAAQGEWALQLPQKKYIQSAAFELAPGKAVTISFAARSAAGEATMGWQCAPCAREVASQHKQTWGLRAAHPVKIGPAWRRYAFTFTPTAPQTGLWPRPTYMLQLGEGDRPVLLDAVTVAYGAGESAYLPRRAVEVQVDSPSLKGYLDDGANILERGQEVTLTGAAANPGAEDRDVTLRWQFIDYEGAAPLGAPVEKKVRIPAGKTVTQSVSMKLAPTGLVLARFSALDARGAALDSSDLPLTSLPYPKASTRPDWRERFGGSLWGPHVARQQQKIGFAWTRWHPHMNWKDHQPDGPDSWKWYDKELDMLASFGISTHAVLYGKPKWAFADPKDNLPRDMQWAADDPRWDDLSLQTAWDRFVTAAAKHYQGRSLVYEIENEPELDHWDKIKEVYARFTIRTARLIKLADPKARVMVDNVYGIPSALNRVLLERGGGKWIDIISWHDYHEGWLADATAMRRMRNALESLGCGQIEIWFNEGWCYTNTAVDEPAVALTNLSAAQSANATFACVAELTAAGQDKTILFHTGYENHGMSFWDYYGPGTMLWDFYDYPLPTLPAWNVLAHHIGLSERVAFIRPAGANLCVFQDLRNSRGVAIAYADRGAKADARVKLPFPNALAEDIMGNPVKLAGSELVLAKNGRPVILYTSDKLGGKAMAGLLAPLDRKNAGFVDAAAKTFRLPLAWEGTAKGLAQGNPILAEGKPVWRIDQVWPDDPMMAEDYRPMPWSGTAWYPAEHAAGGQPEASIESGALRLAVRGPWGGGGDNGKARIAGLVFIAPEPGVYTVAGQAHSKKWTGGAKAFTLGFYKKDTQRAAKIGEASLPSDDAPVRFEFKAELSAGHELVFLPLMNGQWHNATRTVIEDLEIRRTE